MARRHLDSIAVMVSVIAVVSTGVAFSSSALACTLDDRMRVIGFRRANDELLLEHSSQAGDQQAVVELLVFRIVTGATAERIPITTEAEVTRAYDLEGTPSAPDLPGIRLARWQAASAALRKRGFEIAQDYPSLKIVSGAGGPDAVFDLPQLGARLHLKASPAAEGHERFDLIAEKPGSSAVIARQVYYQTRSRFEMGFIEAIYLDPNSRFLVVLGRIPCSSPPVFAISLDEVRRKLQTQ